jgi:hypothetical protein
MPASKYFQRRAALVCFVSAYLLECGDIPTPATLRQALGWPVSTCQNYLKRLRLENLLPSPSFPKQRIFQAHRQHLLELIQEFYALHGYAPSLRWLALESGLSPTTIGKYLRRMREQGLVEFNQGIPRSLRVK